jgi:hypothetical protein
MSIAADDQPLPRRGRFQKKAPAPLPLRDGLKKKLPRRCRDGIQKIFLISQPVTGLN